MGPRQGYEELYRAHHARIRRVCRLLLADRYEAEDVTQEVFLRLHKHIDSISDTEMLRPWLIRVALNVARNMIRGNIRANTREENYVKESGEFFERSVEIDYEEVAGINEICRALNKIKEPLRSCLILKQQGMSYKEIAGSLELNESSIGTYLARARAEFARFYGKIGKETLR